MRTDTGTLFRTIFYTALFNSSVILQNNTVYKHTTATCENSKKNKVQKLPKKEL